MPGSKAIQTTQTTPAALTTGDIIDMKEFRKSTATSFILGKLGVGLSTSVFQSFKLTQGLSNWQQNAAKDSVPLVTVPLQDQNRDLAEFKTDIAQAAKQGMTWYRFSFEWSYLQPDENGAYNPEALAYYDEILATCREYQIEPLVTLRHFAEPYWFTQKGSFQNEENIPIFMQFCEDMFKRFSSIAKYWCTMNEPAVEAFSGYMRGQFPPHEHDLQKTITVLKNLLKAHVAIYQLIKGLPEGDTAQVGLVHNVLRFVSAWDYDFIDAEAARFLTSITNDLVMRFLKTGEFSFQYPDPTLRGFDPWIDELILNSQKVPNIPVKECYVDRQAPYSFDFFGLNFYAEAVLWKFGASYKRGQKVGDMFLPIDPEGFGRAIDAVALLGKPIIITETGIADNQDKLKGDFFGGYTEDGVTHPGYLKVIDDKRDAGVDIVAACFWTQRRPNYEWNEGYVPKFGLFDDDGKPRAGSELLVAYAQKQKAEKDEKVMVIDLKIEEAYRVKVRM